MVKKEKIIEKIIIEEVPRCPECGSTSLKKDPARGEIYCENCGLVVEENLIDFGPEWRAF
ncbi:transcription initiation factor IIB, partial [Nanoarchaeota archaeon]